MNQRSGSEEARRRTEADLEALGIFLDAKFQGPFGTRFGWDGLLGLIPGIGDLTTTVASSYIIVRAAMIGVSFSVLLRMIGNVFVDNLIDLIPLVGWIGDFAWKANLKNLELLRRHSENPRELTRRSRLLVVMVVTLVLVFMIGLAVLMGMLAWRILQFSLELIRELGTGSGF